MSHEHHFGKREVAFAATGMVTLASILYVQNHKHSAKTADELEVPSDYRLKTAILLETRLRDKRPIVNRLAAHILQLETPSGVQLRERMNVTKHKISHFAGYLVSHQLIERVQFSAVQQIPAHYAPTDALRWAATRPDEFHDLAASLEELRTSDASGNYQS